MPSTEETAINGCGSRLAGRYLTFRCGTESFGINVLSVREIIRRSPLTSVPGVPGHVRGVLNLRGRVISVIDLKHRFGLGAADDGTRSCIVVAQVFLTPGRPSQIGLIVDAVEEVAGIGPGDICETPDFGLGLDTSFILCMAKVRGEVKTLLNLERVISRNDAACAEAVHETANT